MNFQTEFTPLKIQTFVSLVRILDGDLAQNTHSADEHPTPLDEVAPSRSQGILGGVKRSSLASRLSGCGSLPGEQQTLACQLRMNFTFLKGPEENETDTICGPQSLKYLLSGPLGKSLSALSPLALTDNT